MGTQGIATTSILTVTLLAAVAHADEGFMGTFSAYVGAEASKKKCDKKNGGGNQAFYSPNGHTPQQFATEDGTSSKGPVMLAVPADLLEKYRGCKVSAPGLGDNFFIDDKCPGCTGTQFDVSFKNTDAACAVAKSFKKKIENVKINCPGGDRSKEYVERAPPDRPKSEWGKFKKGQFTAYP